MTAFIVLVVLFVNALLPVAVQAQYAKLTGDDPAEAFGQFNTVALSGDAQYAIVGAYKDDIETTDQGSAYIYSRRGENIWSQDTKIFSDDLSSKKYPYFGFSVDMNEVGDRVVVGAYFDDLTNTDGAIGSDDGSAYVYSRDGSGSWTQEAKLTADDGAPQDHFGRDVSISGDGERIIVGANLTENDGNSDQGSAYVYSRDGSGNWTQEAKITGDDLAESTGANFGFSVSMDASGAKAVVGASGADPTSETMDGGSVYVFTRGSDGSWSQQAKLVADDLAEGDNFGHDTEISDDGERIIVGANLKDRFGSTPSEDDNPDQGRAYIFTRGGDGTWAQEAKFTGDDVVSGSSFPYYGWSVSIDADGDRAMVSALYADVSDPDGADNGSDEGSVYVYTRKGAGNWVEEYLLPNDNAAGDLFGTSTSISDDGKYALIGAVRDEVDGTANQGSAYVFGPASLPMPVETKAGSMDKAFTLSAAYPNPVRERGTVELAVQVAQPVTATLYDALGRQVRVLYEGRMAGNVPKRLPINARDLPGGVYILHVQGEHFSASRKVVFVR